MNRTKRLLVLSISIIATMVASRSINAQDHIPWRYDLEQAKKVAAEENKLILLHFSASWCGPCKEIERFVFVNPMAIRAISGQVVPVKVDVDLHTHVAEEYGVTSVPYDIIITAAGHVIAERSSPRSSDGYLQMIDEAKSGATNTSQKVLDETAQLRDEIRRQQIARAEKQQAEKSFGGLPEAEANQYEQTYQAPKGIEVPKFENPKPWSQTNVTQTPAASRDGVIENHFVAQSGDFKPSLPEVKSPKIETSKIAEAASAGGQFVPPKVAETETRVISRTQPEATPAIVASQGQGDFVDNRHAAKPAASAPGMENAIARQTQSTRIVNPMFQSKPDPVALKTPRTPAATQPPEKHKMGLDGYCSVTLMEKQKWVKGDKRWGCFHRGRLYLFTSEEYRSQFQMSPDMFSPLLGGSDPVSYHEQGSLVNGMRKHGVFYGEEEGPTVIVLFSNAENRARFEADPTEYLRTVRQAMSRVDSDLLLR